MRYEDSYPFANDPRMLAKLHSIASTNTSRFAAFRGGPAAAPEADGEEWPLDSGAGWNLGDASAKESLGRNIDDSLLPEEAKQVARHELDRGETEHVDLLLSLPWGKRSEVCVNLADAQRRLDAGHYGLAKAKRCIIEYLAVQALSDRPPPQAHFLSC